MEEGHVVWWVHIYPVPEWWAHQAKKRGGWSDAPIMRSAYRTSLWGQRYDLGLLQLVRSRFRNVICPKNEVSWLPEYFEWPGYSTRGILLSSLMTRAYSKITMPWFIMLNLWKIGSGNAKHHFHTWIGHHRVQTQTPVRIFGMCWRRLNATLDGNKCDRAEAYRNGATENVCRNQS